MKLTVVLDLVGTFVFAISGATAGIKHKLDIFGILVLSFAAANAGGITRDLLIGATPPPAITDWRYIVVAFLAGLVTFFCNRKLHRLRDVVLVFDAAGLAVFAVSGTLKALAFHLGPLTAMLLGMLTGIGGGMLRDILVADIPAVLSGDIYALAALAGAAVVVIGTKLHLPSEPVTAAGAVLCFGLRLVAIKRKWSLPTAAQSQDLIASQASIESKLEMTRRSDESTEV